MQSNDPQQAPDPLLGNGQTFRRAIYALLIATTLGGLTGRICRVQSADRRTPFLSANDRSRWCTVRSLVHNRTFAIDHVNNKRGWQTIDRVRHVGRDGRMHDYSSKPTLFPTLLAGEYWLVRQITGASIIRQPFFVGRWMLVLTNVTILGVYLGVMALIIEKWGTTSWGRLFAMTAACWGTFLTTFGITINNHLPAAASVAVAFYFALEIWYGQQRAAWCFFLAGLSGAFAAANELPALSFFAALTVALGYRAWRPTLTWFGAGALLVAAGFFTTNYLAHGTLLPAYGMEEWYAYEGSPWLPENRQGIDRGEPSWVRYAVHCTVGHHGIVTLTPMWLLSIGGSVIWSRRDRKPAMTILITLLTAVCLAFYIFVARDKNYGGVTSGLRWMFWLAPLWLFAMLPAVDAMAWSRWGRRCAVLLLLLSAASAGYSVMNPWVHPWLYEYWLAMGWA